MIKGIDIHSVGGVILNDRDEILIQFHNKYNCWTIPMGKVENNLSIIETLRKEFKEELDIDVEECEEIISRKFIYDNINPKDWTYENGGKTFVAMFHLFMVKKWNGEIKNKEPQKHSELRFFDVDLIRTIRARSDALNLYLEFIEDNIERHPSYNNMFPDTP